MKEGTGHGDSNLPKEEEVTVEEKTEKKGWLKKAGKIAGGVAIHVGLPVVTAIVTTKFAVGDWRVPFIGKKSPAGTEETTTRNEEVAQQPRGEFRNNNSNNGGYRNNNNYQPRG